MYFNFKPFGGKKVTQFVKNDQDRKAQQQLAYFNQKFH